VAENLAELAEIARGEEDYWENEVAGWMGTAVHWSEPDWVREAASGTGLVQIGMVDKESEPDARLLLREKRNKEGRLALIATQSARRGAVAPSGPSRDKKRFAQDDNEKAAGSEPRLRIARAPWLAMNASVRRLWFLGEPVAVQRRLVKAIGEQAGIPLEFKHVKEVVRFAAEEGGRELSLPLGWKVRREDDELVFVTPNLRQPVQPQNYDYELPVPGRIVVNETGSQIEALRIPAGAEAGHNAEQLLDAESLPGPLQVRNWRPGDRFWPAHTKSPKKIKELLQERHVAQPERRLWPVVVSGEEVVWVRGFLRPAKFQARPGREAILIVETPISARPTT
jgi:tRNA(Ile)-lysidine synthetase-like protein